MTALLLRLHPASSNPIRWRVLGTSALLLTALLTSALLVARTADGRELITRAVWPVMALVLWGAAGVQLLLPAARCRAGTLALTLPVSGRKLWGVSLLGSILVSALTAAILIGILEVMAWQIGRVMVIALIPPGAFVQAGLGPMLAASTLAAALLHLPRPGMHYWPLRGGLAIYGLASVVVPGLLLIAFQRRPLAFSLGCLAAAAVLAGVGLSLQPGALRLEVNHAGHGAAPSWRLPAWSWLMTVRWSFGLPTAAAAVLVVLAFGVLQAGLSGRHAEEDETGLLMLPMLIYIMLAWLAVAGRSLHRLSPLPLSRRAIAALITLPVLTAALSGYGLGSWLGGFDARKPRVEFQAEAGQAFPLQKTGRALVRLPAQRYRIAWDGQAPLLRAPWGETHAPWQVRVWKGAAPTLYSPVSTDEPKSPEFAAWEVSRAMELVYGVRVPHQQILETHLTLDASGQPAAKRDLRDLVPRHAPALALDWAVAPLTVAIAGTAYLLLAGLLFGLRRADAPMWRRNTVVALVMGGLFVLYVIRIPLSLAGVSRGWILGGAVSSMVHTAVADTPGGAVTLWVLAGVSIALAFLYAADRLRRAEILPEPPRRFGF